MSDVSFAAPMPAQQRGQIQNGQLVHYGDEADLSVAFYKNAVTGKDHIKIAFPGDKHSTFDQPVREKDKIRFARAWQDYETVGVQFAGQTRLEEVAWMNEATVNSFRALNIFTVEQLAAVQEGNIHNLGGGARSWIAKAKAHVDERRKVDMADAAEAKTAVLESQLAALQAQIDELSKPRRGRPPREESEG